MPTVEARVGVVIRTKDRPSFLARALEDVLEQTFSAWRVVIANDGGDRAQVDGVVERFADRLGERITVVDVPRPGGRCAAANLGITTVGTEFVVLHDDDDTWAPGFLEAGVARLDARPDEIAVAVPIEIVFERVSGADVVETGRERLFPELTHITYYDMLTLNRTVPIGVLYRTVAHERVGGYDETLDAVEDWDFYLRLLVDHEMGYLEGEPLAYWHLRPRSSGASGNSMYALAESHRRFDTIVRDRAVRQLAREYGQGLPLLVAGLVERAAAEQREFILLRNPLRRIVRRLRARRR